MAQFAFPVRHSELFARLSYNAYLIKLLNPIPTMETKEYLTKAKYEELKAELDDLKKTKRREIAESLEYAKSMGDLAENAEYHEAREMQAKLEERIAKLEVILQHAAILPAHHGGKVSIGAKVVVEKESDKSRKTYQIVGSEESDIASGKISHHSPLGLALEGKSKGDKFDLKTPTGKISYVIVQVE